MNRRAFLAGAMTLPWATTGCASKRKPRPVTYGGVECLVLDFEKKASAPPFTVVAIHANGGAPEHWVDGFATFPGQARVVLPRSSTPQGWFSWPEPRDLASEKLAAAVTTAEDRLARALVALREADKLPLAVCGYAEGAMLSLVLAQRPSLVFGAFAVAGACPRTLYPKKAAAPVVAYHGGKDDVFRVEDAREAIAAYKTAGGSAVLREYAGVGHDPSDRMHKDLDDDIVKAGEAASRP